MFEIHASKTTFAMMTMSALLGSSGCYGQPGDVEDVDQAASAVTTAGTWWDTPIAYGVNRTVTCFGSTTEAEVRIGLLVWTDQSRVTITGLSMPGTSVAATTSATLASGQSQHFQAQDSSGSSIDATIAIDRDASDNLTIAFSGDSITNPWWSGSLTCAATVLNYVNPTASNVAVSGTPYVSSTLTGSYTFADATNTTESGSTFQWYRVVSGVSTAISGATSATYAPTGADTNNALKFCVTPRDAARSGIDACSSEVTVPGVLWYTGATQTGTPSAQPSTNGQCVTMSSINLDRLANSVRLDGQASGQTTLRMYTGTGCAGTVYTRYAGANTVHDIELATVGIGSNTRSYKITW